ncbi:chromosome segregation protein SMC [Hyphococcus luteus]|uniref:Chromosome partition protein Smc n=1 Tax=Hyphococcus luteus TaxID=2058213 RepID=A0A2S7K8F9_9PROT|nr:chromosome segregation protein SMC [Marinicaulis flavus]PQA88749.1 chromosome segregation protein SMC [Marinicaulis flavus]
MKFTNVRLVGFKSFVEPTDFEIREGLTGIVGPNGCGKSNLLEALRWVMGATSAKALRGDGMEAVIFAGTSMRPSRNWAEVILSLDNSDRSAPAEYNEHDTLEISRRIIRKEEGTQSVYRINQKEVRAKDVQLLFADASSGANSPALVRQGQISELISAKPQNRRRLLEEAAGVTGLHSRRHEAELRLRAAEQNLERLDDVIGELETQKTALARQARQATRYRNVSGDIRRTEAMLAYLRWREAVEAQEKAAAGLAEISELIEETARVAATASTAQTKAHEELEPLRMAEAEAAAALHRLTVARESLDEEAARAEAELARLAGEIERLKNDMAREKDLLTDADDAVTALSGEEGELRQREEGQAEQVAAAQAAMNEAAAALEAAEARFDEKSKEAADIEARRKAATNNLAAAERRLEKIVEQTRSYTDERQLIEPTPEQAEAFEAAKVKFTAAEEAASAAEEAFQRAEEERAAAETRENELRGPLRSAEQSVTELDAEREALRRVLAANESEDWTPLIEMIDVDAGYENALAAALGDDLGAAVDDKAPAHWASIGENAADMALPEGASPLLGFVRAPSALNRRLSAIGVIDAADGERLRAQLKPGQRLVSREGDLWRWDGYTTYADAKTSAAIRLEQRNRLQVLDREFESAEESAETARREHAEASETLKAKQQNERDARALFTDARRALDSARTKLNELEREHERALARLSSIDENLSRLAEEKTETERNHESLTAEVAAFPDAEHIAEGVEAAREEVASARAKAAETRTAHNELASEARRRAERLEEIARDRASWAQRGDAARKRIGDIESHLSETVTAHEAAQGAPAVIEEKRKALLDQIETAEKRRNDAADALAEGQRMTVEADKAAKMADHEAAEAREARARLEAQAEAAAERVEEAKHLAHETCEAEPDELLAIAEHKEGADLPNRDDVDRKLERYKRERENLGGVNLRADEEMQEVSERLEELATEREDCDNAIRKLRTGITNLNREARQRLLDAFETVNNNFADLFKRLFNGGQAELRLIESDDPLEAGLEIMASPPGKKLASMSLMSGGEQALTATALIFAVFMANPAPVCVLDEVDAPLDDANVERFCRLLHEMAQETETRFVIITHHALTMSRMNRLFGVTMIERGVSQLVSVDLNKAEQLAAAE